MKFAQPPYIIVGDLRREYILPPDAPPQTDIPGGDVLYAACAAALWTDGIGLISIAGEDYPRRWLLDMQNYGLDTRGIHILPKRIDLRWFRAYSPQGDSLAERPMAAFANRNRPYPKSLLGYQGKENTHFYNNPSFTKYIPADYLSARSAHICPLHPGMQTHLTGLFKQNNIQNISVAVSPEAARPNRLDDLYALMQSVTTVFIREAQLRQFFFGETDQIQEMLETLQSKSGELVVILRHFQSLVLLDIPGRKRWEINAYPTRLIDPTGYEDALAGGFMVGFRQTYDGVEGALHGLASASIAQEGSGPFYIMDVHPALPTARKEALRSQIKAF